MPARLAGNVTITSNSGTISGDVAGVTSSGNLTVTSNSGTLSGNATGITSGGNVTVTSNSGTISSSTSGIGASSFAINAGTETTDANVTNTSTGKIMAKEAAGGLQAIGILAKTATVNNAGLISASGPDAINDGINTTGLTTITNAATGTISSSSRSGVRVNNATITNDGLITGNEGIVFRNAGATGSVVNSGTITGTGGIAIDYGLNGSANPFTLTLEPGSVINGKVMSTRRDHRARQLPARRKRQRNLRREHARAGSTICRLFGLQQDRLLDLDAHREQQLLRRDECRTGRARRERLARRARS